MKKKELIVHYTCEGRETADKVIKESFRLFLQKELCAFAIEHDTRV